MPIVSPGLRLLSISAFITHSLRVCAMQPILLEIDVIAAQRDGCLPRSEGES